ncbi:MAG: glycosyltransferase family 2 protein [Gemmataceae bacterium]
MVRLLVHELNPKLPAYKMLTPMKLSVAVATFNGEPHLAEQLHSIRAQTRLPYEVILVDDASTDGTRLVAEGFARTSPIPVRIIRNETNSGSTSAFGRAIAACTGEVVVLADQDDVWRPYKLEMLATALADQPEAAFAFSDAELVDEKLQPLGHRLWEAIRFREPEQRRFRCGGGFECLLRRHRVTGATMAFRAAFRDRILPIPEGWVHDAWIALILSATSPCAFVAEPLIEYRQHSNQQQGARMRSLLGEFQAARSLTAAECESVSDRFEEALRRLEQFDDVPLVRLARLREKIEHHRRRARLRESGRWRLPGVLLDVLRGRYSRFDQGWKTIAQDLLLK